MKNKFLNRIVFRIASAVLTAGIAFGGLGAIKASAAPKEVAAGIFFDAEYYAAANPDVVAIVGTDPNALYQHWLNYGALEGRKPYLGCDIAFDAAFYAASNPDVVAAVGTDTMALYKHYITIGIYEGRFANTEQSLNASKKAAEAKKKAEQDELYKKIVNKIDYETKYTDSVYNFINQTRAYKDSPVNPVDIGASLKGPAEMRVEEIQEEFSHIRPNHADFHSAIRFNHLHYECEGELIAYAADPADAIASWKRNPDDMKTIEDGAYKKIGIAVENGYCVVIFIGGNAIDDDDD
ncbi:MAG: hypothetical protein K6C99_10260 [Lachnospiraceae bacterium]|nr:hypothetical protein [Lachnospiraceae bacterium]